MEIQDTQCKCLTEHSWRRGAELTPKAVLCYKRTSLKYVYFTLVSNVTEHLTLFHTWRGRITTSPRDFNMSHVLSSRPTAGPSMTERSQVGPYVAHYSAASSQPNQTNNKQTNCFLVPQKQWRHIRIFREPELQRTPAHSFLSGLSETRNRKDFPPSRRLSFGYFQLEVWSSAERYKK